MSRNSYCNSGPGASAYNGNGQGPAVRNPYLGDERIGGEHWWHLV